MFKDKASLQAGSRGTCNSPYLYAMPRIRFLERKEIDVDRWDRCVRESPHGDVYALSGWLDIMAGQWGGLVQDDYAAVLPIPSNRKYFLSYIYTPRFTSPLPLCGDPATTLPLANFLTRIPKKFVLWDLDISSPASHEPVPHKHHHRTNYILPLESGYEELFGRFRPGYRNLIRKAQHKGFIAQTTTDFAGIIKLAARKKEIKGMKAHDYEKFTSLCHWLAPQGMLETWEILSHRGDRCASAVFAKNHRKLYYLLAWNNEAGREGSASHLLIDRLICTHAGSGRVLDFEGSDHPGIAFFMKGFAGMPARYLHIGYNILSK